MKMENSEERQKIVSAFKKDIQMPDAEEEWQKVAKKMNQIEKQANQTTRDSHKNNHAVSAIAAGILLLLALSSIFIVYKNYTTEPIGEEMAIREVFQEYEFATDYGEKRTFALSDGSTIILNANSRLTFSSSAVEGDVTTEVRLEGEAYFDITHLEGDKKRTFTVHTPAGSVEVLGTRFLVNTYNGNTQAVLEKGKIAVRLGSSIENFSDQQKIYYMNPGNIATFNADTHKKGITIEKVNTKVYTSWTKNKMVFDETPLADVAERIERSYGIDVIIGKAAAGIKLSGSIKTDNLEVLKGALKKILSNNNVKLQNNTLLVQ